MKSPSHALQRPAPGVTACAPTRRPAPSAFPHGLRRPPQSLTLGSVATEMKSLISAIILATCCVVSGQDAGTDRASLLLEFTPAVSKVLDRPFKGSIRVVWPKGEIEAKPESVHLNLMRPADDHNGHSPINTPYLATTEDGSSYWGAFALRPKLPDTIRLTLFSSYKEFVDLLGDPTHLPIGGGDRRQMGL